MAHLDNDRMDDLATVQDSIEAALIELGRFLRDSEWYGRENELVNLFAHSFLTGRSGPDGPIQASQLGIEVAVKQLVRSGGKALVRKDLVLWARPNQTVWSRGETTNIPAAVMEFKVNDSGKCAPDLAWLAEYTRLYPGVIGYSVCGFIRRRRGVSFVRVTRGECSNSLSCPADVSA